MRLLKLGLENYRMFQERTEIDFTAGRVEPGRNVFLIGGMNNAGKTTIMDAINTCLYGQKKAVIHEAISKNQINKQNVRCSIELSLETDEGSELTVTRSWTAHGLFPPPSAEELVEEISLVTDGKQASRVSEARWAEFRDTMIPKAVAQFFFFDGEKIKEMVADEHSEQSLKDSMEAVLGIGAIRKLINDVKKIQDEERRKRRDATTEKDISSKKKEIEFLVAKLAKNKELGDHARIEIAEFEGKREELKRKFSEKFSPDQKDVKKGEEFRREQRDLDNKLSQVDREVQQYAEHSLPLSFLMEHFVELRKQIDAERRATKGAAVRDQAAALADAIVQAAARPKTVCCHDEMSELAKQELRKRVLAVIFGVPDAALPPGQNPDLLQLSDADATRVLDRLDQIERGDPLRLRAALGKKADLAFELRIVEEHVRRISVPDADKDEFDRLQADIESYSAQIGRLHEEETHNIDECLKIEKQIEDQNRELDGFYRRLPGAKEQEAFIRKCESLIDLLNEYLDRVRESRILTLQERTSDMYRTLASKGDLIESLEIDPESYRVTIRNISGHEVAKHNLSAGEKEVYMISLLWGLAQTSELNLPVVIDTPLSRLDSKHRDRIVAHYFPHAAHQVVLLSTDTEVDQSWFARLEPHLQRTIRLQFDKTREQTTIEEGYFWE